MLGFFHRAAAEQKAREDKAALKKKRERARRQAQTAPKERSLAAKDTRANRHRTESASSQRGKAQAGALSDGGDESGGNIFDRLTDTAQYTGAHKKRFGQGGQGLGLAGRRDSQATIWDLSTVLKDDHVNKGGSPETVPGWHQQGQQPARRQKQSAAGECHDEDVAFSRNASIHTIAEVDTVVTDISTSDDSDDDSGRGSGVVSDENETEGGGAARRVTFLQVQDR